LEAGTEQKPPAQKRLTVFGETARRKRTFARPRASWAYDGFAREERLKPRRVREIEVLQREIDDAANYLLVQPSRLALPLRVAVADGDVGTITPLIKVDRDGAAHQAFCAPPATRPEIAPQAIENARFALVKAMVSKLWTHKIWHRGGSSLLCRSEPVFSDAEKRIDTVQSAREWRRKPL